MKILKISTSIIIILFILIFPVSIILIKFDNSGILGKHIKEIVIRHPGLVSFLNLNEPGDNRFRYLGNGNQEIKVSILSVNETPVDEKVSGWITEMVHETTGKRVVVSDLKPLNYKSGLLKDDDLNNIRNLLLSERGVVSDLNIIYAGYYSEKPTSIGLVIHRDTIFIFKDALLKLSEKRTVNSILEKTTIMHEWGHLLGVDHINNEDCIMSETVEVFDNPSPGRPLPAKYCWEELEAVKHIRDKIL